MLRNRATPVRHKFITFVLERKPSKMGTAAGVLRMGFLAAGAAAQVAEIAVMVAAHAKSDTIEAQAAARTGREGWQVSYSVKSKWFASTNTTSTPTGQRTVLQKEAGKTADETTVPSQPAADLVNWQPSGAAVGDYLSSYSAVGSHKEVAEEAYDLTELSGWTAWGDVASGIRAAIGAQLGAASSWHDVRTMVRYASTNVEELSAVTAADVSDQLVHLPLDQAWLNTNAATRKKLGSLPDVDERKGLYSALGLTPPAKPAEAPHEVLWNAATSTLTLFANSTAAGVDFTGAALAGEHPADFLILADLNGSTRVDALPASGHLTDAQVRTAVKTLKLQNATGGDVPLVDASTPLAAGSVVSTSTATPLQHASLVADGIVETTYSITISNEMVPAATGTTGAQDWEQILGGIGLNTEFMRWFAEFQEIDYQGNVANADGFYELGTNGPRPRFRTADWDGVTLKTGFVNQGWLFEWTQQVDWGKDFRKDLAIIMFDRGGIPLRIIRVCNAFPVSWKGPPLSAGGSGTQPIESISLTCESLEVTVIPV
jgi:phage tail-like protein